jgi:hypothetical protein
LKINALFSLMIVFLFVVTGYASEIKNKEQKIVVFGDGGSKEITDNKKVSQVNKILNDTDWENAEVQMARSPDYSFQIVPKDESIEAKAVTYDVWISPNKDKLEIVKEDVQYNQLTKENSALLFEIMIGEKLADLK